MENGRGVNLWRVSVKPALSPKQIVRSAQVAADARAKFGPRRKAAPVVVRSLESGKVMAVRKSGAFAKRRKRSGRAYSANLDRAARAAGFESYGAYLQSPYWRAIRELVLRRDGYRCRACLTRSPPLTVHHRGYAGVIGHEDVASLKTLCWPCHRKRHR